MTNQSKNTGPVKLSAKERPLRAFVAFSGNLVELDVDAAADALRKAGYRVYRLPGKYTTRLTHPLDDFIEAHTVADDCDKVIDAIMDEVDGIVDPYGGWCVECGPVEPDNVPFAEMFDPTRFRAPQ
jgi:hypothetical protein